MTRTLVALLTLLGMLAGLAPDAEAQRRRRRRRRRPPPVEEPAEPTPDPQADADAGTPDADAGVEAPPAAQLEGDGEPPPEGSELPPPDPTEEPSETPTAAFDPGPAPPDVSPIRADYVALMDDLVQARMRVHALGSELFRTRISVDVQDRTGDGVSLARIVVRLDGAPVFQRDGPIEGGEAGARVFEGALAPGPHVLRLELDQRQAEDAAYRYTVAQSFRFQVVRERSNEVTLILEDGSDMASSFPSGGEGRYEVRTRMRVAARALND